MAENREMFGVWKAYKSENMAAALEKAGAPWMARKMGANATPTVTLTRLDDKRITVTSKSAVFTIEQTFELDGTVEFQPPFQSDKQAFYAEWVDGRLVIYQGPVGSDPKSSGNKQVRSLESNGEMLLTVIIGNVTAYRWFKREG